MKKIFLLSIFTTFFFFNSFAFQYYVYIYKVCGSDRVLVSKGGEDGNFNFDKSVNCFEICNGCKLEISISDLTESGDYLNSLSITNGLMIVNNGGINNTGSGTILGNLIDYNGRKFISFDLTNKYGTIQSLTLGSGKIVSNFSLSACFKIIPSNNKDNIDFVTPSQICKGDCNVKIGDLIRNPNNVDIVSWGCGNDFIIPNHTEPNLNNRYLPCFNELGFFTLCATVKDACGEKNITQQFEVIDCEGEQNINCVACCAYLTTQNVLIQSSPSAPNIYYLTPPLGDIAACGAGYFEITYSNGTTTRISNTFINLESGINTVVTICYKIPGCPSCNIPCLNVR